MPRGMKSIRKIHSTDRKVLRDRILSKVVIDKETGCWNWIGGGSATRPMMKIKTFSVSARRVSYYAFGGVKLKAHKKVFTHCDNNMCVNPNHLSLKMGGPDLERRRSGPGMTGAFSGRNYRRDGYPSAKLKIEEVKAILREYKCRKYLKRGVGDIKNFYKEFAEKYGVAPKTIRKVCYRETWRNVSIGHSFQKFPSSPYQRPTKE